MDERLRNWGAVMRDRRRQNHCASIEHRYRSPQWWHPPEPKPTLDVLDAYFVQDVIAEEVQASRLTVSQVRALHYAYIEPWADRWKAAVRCRVFTPRKLEESTKVARNLVLNALKRKQMERHHSYNNSESIGTS